MERVKKALKMPNKQFKRIIGTTKPVFLMMKNVLEIAQEKLHETGGKPPNLTVGDKLLITLQYYREYRTMESIAVGCDFGGQRLSGYSKLLSLEFDTDQKEQKPPVDGRGKGIQSGVIPAENCD